MRRSYPLTAISVLIFALLFTSACSDSRADSRQTSSVNQQQIPAGLNVKFGTLPGAIQEGQETFRFDTFGDERFWGDALKLHRAIEGEKFGGVGDGVSPNAALSAGLMVDSEALPAQLIAQLKEGQVNLDDPATTLALLKLNAVVGVTGFFNNDGSLKSIGIQCSLCHSTVDDSFAPGIGRRLDGWANRDLNVGAIISLAPDLTPFVEALKVVNPDINTAEVRKVLNSWGPGKFDAQLLLDGKAFRPDGKPAATLLPNAYGLLGHNLHTWTADWGNVTYWNAFVAAIEMGGIGNFHDPRLDDVDQFPDIAPRFPIAVAKKLGHITVDPDQDRITKKLSGLHLYQLALDAPKPKPNTDFDPAAAERGNELFNGKGKCGTCHVEPLWTEPGWNAHKPADIGIDSFQADRSPGRAYKTMNLAGIFVRERGLFMKSENKGRFYHDGRFKTLLDVVNHYNTTLALGLTDAEKSDIVEYVKSL